MTEIPYEELLALKTLLESKDVNNRMIGEGIMYSQYLPQIEDEETKCVEGPNGNLYIMVEESTNFIRANHLFTYVEEFEAQLCTKWLKVNYYPHVSSGQSYIYLVMPLANPLDPCILGIASDGYQNVEDVYFTEDYKHLGEALAENISEFCCQSTDFLRVLTFPNMRKIYWK